jgi:hypothetical protein
MNNTKKTPLQIAIRVIIIIIILILLFLVTLGIVKLLPKAFNSLSGLKSSVNESPTATSTVVSEPSEKIVVDVDPSIFDSNDEGVVTWERIGGKNTGYYTFEYSCTEGVVIEMENDDDEDFQGLACGQPVKTMSNDSYPIHAVNNSPDEKEVTITISHRKTSFFIFTANYAVGTTTLKVRGQSEDTETPSLEENDHSDNAATSTERETRRPAPTRDPAPIRPAPTTYAGPSDLVVNITRIITAPDGRINVQFQVTNIGQRPTGTYKFRAYIPTSVEKNQIFDSAYQSSIPRGGTSYFTLGFYGLNQTNDQFRVIVDPNNQIVEKSESNNESSSFIRANR